MAAGGPAMLAAYPAVAAAATIPKYASQRMGRQAGEAVMDKVAGAGGPIPDVAAAAIQSGSAIGGEQGVDMQNPNIDFNQMKRAIR